MGQLLDVPEDPADQLSCGCWIIQGDVVRDGIEIRKRGLGPDQALVEPSRHLCAGFIVGEAALFLYGPLTAGDPFQ